MNVDDGLLVDFLLDAVAADVAARIRRELENDGALRARLAGLSEDLALLATTAAPAAPSDRLRTRVLASQEPAGLLPGLRDRLAALFDLPSAAITDLSTDIERAPYAPWQPGPAPGISLLPVTPGPRVGRAAAHLVHVAAGADLPEHEHLGRETMLILDGHALESSGRTVAPGDVIDSEAASRHRFEILVDAPCLFAVVLEGAVRFDRDDPS